MQSAAVLCLVAAAVAASAQSAGRKARGDLGMDAEVPAAAKIIPALGPVPGSSAKDPMSIGTSSNDQSPAASFPYGTQLVASPSHYMGDMVASASKKKGYKKKKSHKKKGGKKKKKGYKKKKGHKKKKSHKKGSKGMHKKGHKKKVLILIKSCLDTFVHITINFLLYSDLKSLLSFCTY